MPSRRFLDQLSEKCMREAFVEAEVELMVAQQIRTLREQRGWSGQQLAKVLGVPQSVVSRLENPDYGRHSLRTLLRLAHAFDVGLTVRFQAIPAWADFNRDKSAAALSAEPFTVAETEQN